MSSFVRTWWERFGISFIFLVMSFGVAFFLYANRIQKEKAHYSEYMTNLDIAYRASVQMYRLAMDCFFANTLNRPEVVDLLDEVSSVSEEQRNILRGRLYRRLFATYESMQQQNLRQLHFHLPDGTSFLRFHLSDHHGDNVFSSRHTVRIANEEQRVVHGFEIGKTATGFRYVYPLWSKGRHVGSVEVVLTTKAIRDAMAELDSSREFSFLLLRQVTEPILFPEQRWLYSPSELNPDFLIEDPNALLSSSPPALSPSAQEINRLLRDREEIRDAMRAGRSKATYAEINGRAYVVTMLPLRDVRTQVAGYLVTYALDPVVTKFRQEFYVYLLFSIAALGLVHVLVRRLRQRGRALDVEQRNLQAMNDALAEGVYVVDSDGVITRVNQAACQILGYAPQELLGQVAHDLFHSHEGNEHCSRIECPFYLRTSRGRAYDGEEFFRAKDGHLVLVEVASRPIFQSGLFVASVTAFRDITERKRIENALRASEEKGRRLSAAVEQSPASVLVTDVHGNIEYVNPKFEQLTGYSLAEVYGKNPRILKSGEMPASFYTELWQTILAGQSWKGELRNRRKDGSLFWEVVAISPIRDNAGEVTHFVALKEDITERMLMEQALRESEFLQRTVMESLPIGLVIIDAETRVIERANPKAAEMFGAPESAIIGRRCHKFLCPAEECSCPIGNLGQTVDNSDRIMIRHDGSSMPILKTVTTITVQGRSKYIECFIDIMARKAAEDALLEANRQLEVAIARAEELAREADAANRAKGDFLANMSHEIRTPMNAVIGMTHLALRTELTAQQRDYLSKVEVAAKSLLGILNDILDFSKIEAGKIELEHIEFSLADVLENVMTVVSMRMRETKAEFVIDVDRDVPARLVGDPLRLGQVLINLAGNAAKFTTQGEIRISIGINEVLPNERIRLLFQVLDTGIGMDSAQISKLFEPFVQAEVSTSRRYGGTGLGLSISRRLVDLMGGNLLATSVQGEGSVFSFHGVFVLGTQPEPSLLPESVRGARVVVVDDLDSSRYAVLSMCRDMGLVAEGYASVQEAVAIVQNERVDLVLIDWDVAGTSAVDVWRTVSAAGRTQPKAILMAPLGQEALKRKGLREGFSGVATKPILKHALQDALLGVYGLSVPTLSHARDDDAVCFAGGRVLLVEDNEINQQVARTILEGAGLTVLVAADGEEAVAMAKTQDVDLILMDLQMPRMDGYEATQHIRALPHLHTLPIVAMTAHAVSTVREEILAVGMTDCLTKPIDVHALFAMLSRWFTLACGTIAPSAGDTGAPPSSPDDAPVLLVDEGIARFMGERDMYFESLAELRHMYRDALPAFRQQMADGQDKDARIFVHSLRGAAGNIGAKALHLAASVLEEQIVEHEGNVDMSYVDMFCVHLQRLLDEIGTLVPEEAVNAKPAMNIVELMKMLDDLVPYLQARKPKGSKDIVRALRAWSVPADLEADIEKLDTLVHSYDFTTALRVVMALREDLNRMQSS